MAQAATGWSTVTSVPISPAAPAQLVKATTKSLSEPERASTV